MKPTGLSTLKFPDVKIRYQTLLNQLNAGLQRHEGERAKKGEAAVIQTGIPNITQRVWDEVRIGTKAIVGAFAGTNWTVSFAIKNGKGNIDLTPLKKAVYEIKDRKVTFSTFIERMADLIVAAMTEYKVKETIDVGISFGFPHINTNTNEGIDATLQNTILPKEWIITDFDPKTTPAVTKALRAELVKHHIAIETLVAINDTLAVALDVDAAQRAAELGAEVLPAGFVGGSGTNGAIDRKGLVNTELGHVAWSYQDDVFEEMKKQRYVQAENEVLEYETGMYLPFRLAAAIRLQEDRRLLRKEHNKIIEKLISQDSNRDPEFISKIANGDYQTEEMTKTLAKNILERAGQVYGISLAALAKETGIVIDRKIPKAFLTEGATLLKGYRVSETARKTADHLGQSLIIMPALGLKGVAALAMVYEIIYKTKNEKS